MIEKVLYVSLLIIASKSWSREIIILSGQIRTVHVLLYHAARPNKTETARFATSNLHHFSCIWFPIIQTFLCLFSPLTRTHLAHSSSGADAQNVSSLYFNMERIQITVKVRLVNLCNGLSIYSHGKSYFGGSMQCKSTYTLSPLCNHNYQS